MSRGLDRASHPGQIRFEPLFRRSAILADFKTADDEKTQKVSGVASDGQLWVSRALATVEMLEKDTKHASLLEEADKGDQTVRTKARQVADTLKQVSGDQQETAKGAELLLIASVLQQYSTDNGETDTDALEVRMVCACLRKF